MALLNTVEKEAELKVTKIREKSEAFANGTQVTERATPQRLALEERCFTRKPSVWHICIQGPFFPSRLLMDIKEILIQTGGA